MRPQHPSTIPKQVRVQISMCNMPTAFLDANLSMSRSSSDLSHPSLGRSHSTASSPPASDYFFAFASFPLEQRYLVWDELLGRGTFGVVRTCQCRKSGRRYACKSIRKADLEAGDAIRGLRTETAHMGLLSKHPNIIRYMEVCEDAHYVHIVMERCQPGADLHRLVDTNGALPEPLALDLFRKVASAVSFCHSYNVLHRDLKLENILLSLTRRGGALEPKLADFGLCVDLGENPSCEAREIVGSMYYLAPEVINEQTYSRESDVWSLGVLLFVMLSGKLPYKGSSFREVSRAILTTRLDMSSPPWRRVSFAARCLVQQMLAIHPSKRPSVEAIFHHPLFGSPASSPPPSVPSLPASATLNLGSPAPCPGQSPALCPSPSPSPCPPFPLPSSLSRRSFSCPAALVFPASALGQPRRVSNRTVVPNVHLSANECVPHVLLSSQRVKEVDSCKSKLVETFWTPLVSLLDNSSHSTSLYKNQNIAHSTPLQENPSHENLLHLNLSPANILQSNPLQEHPSCGDPLHASQLYDNPSHDTRMNSNLLRTIPRHNDPLHGTSIHQLPLLSTLSHENATLSRPPLASQPLSDEKCKHHSEERHREGAMSIIGTHGFFGGPPLLSSSSLLHPPTGLLSLCDVSEPLEGHVCRLTAQSMKFSFLDAPSPRPKLRKFLPVGLPNDLAYDGTRVPRASDGTDGKRDATGGIGLIHGKGEIDGVKVLPEKIPAPEQADPIIPSQTMLVPETENKECVPRMIDGRGKGAATGRVANGWLRLSSALVPIPCVTASALPPVQHAQQMLTSEEFLFLLDLRRRLSGKLDNDPKAVPADEERVNGSHPHRIPSDLGGNMADIGNKAPNDGDSPLDTGNAAPSIENVAHGTRNLAPNSKETGPVIKNAACESVSESMQVSMPLLDLLTTAVQSGCLSPKNCQTSAADGNAAQTHCFSTAFVDGVTRQWTPHQEKLPAHPRPQTLDLRPFKRTKSEGQESSEVAFKVKSPPKTQSSSFGQLE
eukprot:TRINITY_DN9764_c0_g1_i1.p1 TRINITY_DN9764_c0_g1~~TRINITY_DN9764_c0_g1_i1.p1  ORF type:complete len:1002 (+),score=94.12 TRINITY_DN9764_c0_g1_i1:372-3377(+)